MAKTRWKLDGVDIDPRRIKLQLLAAYGLELFNAVSAAANNLEDHLNQIKANTSNRGTGFYAVRYNNPMDGAKVEITELSESTSYEVHVPSKGRGTPGYRFNILDQGSPGSSNPNQTFPIYNGTLTTEATFNKAGNFKSGSLDLDFGNVTVKKPTRWYHGPTKGFKGRRIIQTVVQETKEEVGAGDLDGQYLHPQIARLANTAKRDRGPFRWKIDPNEVRISTKKKS